jgi:uncharacterized surface protein with fasciclin (FAS1) repeats
MFLQKSLKASFIALAFATAIGQASAASVDVGGAAMLDDKNIIENAVNSKDHTTLVAAVTAAGLVEVLSGAGPFTVFAPTNDAFAALPAGTVETLLKPENKATLVKILTAHVASGKYSAADIIAKAQKHGGRFNLKMVSGDTITVQVKKSGVYLIDESGHAAKVTIADVNQSNGVIHVTNAVSVPK